jgi:hypothetical protein
VIIVRWELRYVGQWKGHHQTQEMVPRHPWMGHGRHVYFGLGLYSVRQEFHQVLDFYTFYTPHLKSAFAYINMMLLFFAVNKKVRTTTLYRFFLYKKYMGSQAGSTYTQSCVTRPVPVMRNIYLPVLHRNWTFFIRSNLIILLVLKQSAALFRKAQQTSSCTRSK